jgi:CRISPR-associated protein Cmr6
MNKTNIHDSVPMMFRAQTAGRCQVQRIPDRRESEPDITPWTKEWTQEIYPELPLAGEQVQEKIYTFNWRLLSNSGVDDAVIRPVIGARGWPHYPGSSMKGVFRRACSEAEADRYCGKEVKRGDWSPGILRFHGAYPVDTEWRNGLIDITHPQQNKQVGTDDRQTSAFAQISLYQPTLRFGISSNDPEPLSPQEWQKIWQIWEKALACGLGSRVSAGYGYSVEAERQQVLYRAQLQGQGQAAKLLDDSSEFRPNIFRAALRGHALRIFGGLTNAKIAEQAVSDLFGSIQDRGNVGLLGLNFQEISSTLNTFSPGTRWEQSTYDVTGELHWHLQSELPPAPQKALQDLVRGLMHFAMMFGGFGKSWRRADHRLFNSDYYDGNDKPLIGCHWKWSDEATLQRDRSWHVYKLEHISLRIEKLQEAAKKWLEIRNFRLDNAAKWRESWHPANVMVWGRDDANRDDCISMDWIHGNYAYDSSIYRSTLTGQMGNTGRLWQRMYPIVKLRQNPDNKEEPIVRKTSQYLETIVIFPDNSSKTNKFLKFLNEEQSDFQLLWGER